MADSMTVIPLGTAGWIPTDTRSTPAILVEKGDQLFLLDAGSGIRHLLSDWGRAIIDRHDHVDLILSHYHADHIFGLTFFPLVFFRKSVHIYGPGRSMTGYATEDAIETFLQSPIFPVPLREFPMDLEVHNLDEGTTRIGGVRVEVRRQDHSDPTMGVRLDDDLAYVTDTPCAATTSAFARGVKLLLHECWLDRADYDAVQAQRPIPEPGHVLTMHAHADGVAELAKEAGAGRLGLIHLNPRYSESRLRSMAAEAAGIFSGAFLTEDGEAITVE